MTADGNTLSGAARATRASERSTDGPAGGPRNHRRFRGPSTQRGVSMIAIMVIIAVAVFIGLFAIKAGPAYLEHETLKSVVETAAADEALMRSPRTKVYEQLNRQYNFNNLWDLTAEDTVELERDGRTGYSMRVNYEKRENLFANIDLVMRFDRKVPAP